MFNSIIVMTCSNMYMYVKIYITVTKIRCNSDIIAYMYRLRSFYNKRNKKYDHTKGEKILNFETTSEISLLYTAAIHILLGTYIHRMISR